MDREYGYKLENMVNNFNGNTTVSDKISSLKHTISNTDYYLEANEFYSKNAKWLIGLAEENINTVTDLNNYINWISNDE